MAQPHQPAGEEPPPATAADRPTRADALRRIAAEVSGRHDLDGLFRDVIDEAFTLFGVDQAGLWMYDDSPTPLSAVAQRGLSQEILELVNTLPRDAKTLGMDALREQQVKVLSGDLAATVPRLRDDLPTGRGPHDLLRPDRVPRRAARAARPLPPDRLRVDGR